MKVIARTTSPIMLIEPTTRECLEQAPSVVTWTHFLEARAGRGEVEVLASNLPDVASDAEFQRFLKDSDGKIELAVAAFDTSLDDVEEEVVVKRPRRTRKPKAED